MKFWVLMSIFSKVSMQGTMMKMPGPLRAPGRLLPSRYTTALSYSWPAWELSGCFSEFSF